MLVISSLKSHWKVGGKDWMDSLGIPLLAFRIAVWIDTQIVLLVSYVQ